MFSLLKMQNALQHLSVCFVIRLMKNVRHVAFFFFSDKQNMGERVGYLEKSFTKPYKGLSQ